MIKKLLYLIISLTLIFSPIYSVRAESAPFVRSNLTTSSNDSSARWYDPLLSQTTTPDPLAEKYYSISPYTWCAANPLIHTDPDGADWVINNRSKAIKWFDNVTSKKNTPSGYSYIGKSGNDILSSLNLSMSFPKIESNHIGYIAQDINVGFNMANFREESYADISADITRDASKGQKNNINGNYFNGIKINVLENSEHTPIIDTPHSAGEVEVSYGNKLYKGALKTPSKAYLGRYHAESKEVSIFIPAEDLSSSKKMNYVRVTGNWSIETGHGNTMLIRHPFIPFAQNFSHIWKIKK